MWSQLVGSLHKVVLEVRMVEPVLWRHVLDPGMFYSAMIEDHVHHDLNAPVVGFRYQWAIFLVSAETWVYLVIIGCCISVIWAAFHIIFEYRGEPECGHSQVGKIVQILFDTGQVASVTCVRVVAVHFIFGHAFYPVVIRIAIGETVRHQQI